jgi:uncharacterized integral membrane protein
MMQDGDRRSQGERAGAGRRRLTMRREGDPSDGDQGWVEKREGLSGTTIVAIVAVVLLLVFVLQNADDAKVDLLFWDVTLSLWAVIVIGAALGFLVGWFLGRSRMKRRDRRT